MSNKGLLKGPFSFLQTHLSKWLFGEGASKDTEDNVTKKADEKEAAMAKDVGSDYQVGHHLQKSLAGRVGNYRVILMFLHCVFSHW